MNVLVINPNTTESVTEKLVEQACLFLPSEFSVRGITARHGPAVVRSQVGVTQAHQAIRTMLPSIDCDVDAIVLGISLDIGLSDLRQFARVPVFGLSESTLRVAAANRRQVIALTLGSHMLALYADMSKRYGYSGEQVHWYAIDDQQAFSADGPNDNCREVFIERAIELKQQHPSAAFTFVGALLAGLGKYATKRLSNTELVEPMQAVCMELLESLNAKPGAVTP
jgi:allantoin racemase